MDCQSEYSYHQQDKQILEGCLCNQEGQAAIQQTQSVRLFRRFGAGRNKKKQIYVLCCKVIDACMRCVSKINVCFKFDVRV